MSVGPLVVVDQVEVAAKAEAADHRASGRGSQDLLKLGLMVPPGELARPGLQTATVRLGRMVP